MYLYDVDVDKQLNVQTARSDFDKRNGFLWSLFILGSERPYLCLLYSLRGKKFFIVESSRTSYISSIWIKIYWLESSFYIRKRELSPQAGLWTMQPVYNFFTIPFFFSCFFFPHFYFCPLFSSITNSSEWQSCSLLKWRKFQTPLRRSMRVKERTRKGGSPSGSCLFCVVLSPQEKIYYMIPHVELFYFFLFRWY